MKHKVVAELHGKHPIKTMCAFLGISRSGYYRFLKRKNGTDRDAGLKEKIQDLYRQRRGTYGYRRIQVELLRQHGLRVNHKRVLRIMQQLNLQAIIRRKRRIHNQYTAPVGTRVAQNLLNRNFKSERPNEKWVTDVTYVQTGAKTVFLSVIMDLFNNEIVAYHMSERNDNELVLKNLRKALLKRKDVQGTVIHSDRGFQYTSHQYHDMLSRSGQIPSMSRKGNCLDNACVESFFSHLKAEALYPYHIPDFRHAQKRIRDYIRFYNEERIQLKLNRLTPVEYRRQHTA